MIVGVPKEVKADEYRVSMVPAGVEELSRAGHRVLVQKGAGEGSGISDEEYRSNGATIVDTAEEIFGQAELVVKVKEPQEEEWPLLRSEQILFTYFHFAADRVLTNEVLKTGVTAVAYETLRGPNNTLPCLTPMSEIAGRMSIQQGAKFLERPQQGRGVLLGGVPGVESAHVTILGAGVVGKNAAQIAAGMNANVTILDINLERLRYLEDVMPDNVSTLFSDRHNIRRELEKADLVVGAVLIPGARAPHLVRREDLKLMKPGSVIVDVCIDQGGCFETSRPTTHRDPIYVEEGIVHYCVTNMPGAVSRTSTYALCNVTFPYVALIANRGLDAACKQNLGLCDAVNMHRGQVMNKAVAETFGLKYVPWK